MKMFFAGSIQGQYEKLLVTKIRHRLHTFYDYYKNKRTFDGLLPDTVSCTCDFMLDSGAYTFITGKESPDILDDYMSKYVDFLKRNRHRYHMYVEMDLPKVVGPEKYANLLLTFKAANLHPMRVWHPSTPESFEELCWNNDYVGISYKDIKDPAWLEKKLLVANKLGCKIHLFGYTSLDGLSRIRHIPSAYSCDSTSWLSGVQYGRIQIYLKNSKILKTLPKDGIKNKSNEELLFLNVDAWAQWGDELELCGAVTAEQHQLFDDEPIEARIQVPPRLVPKRQRGKQVSMADIKESPRIEGVLDIPTPEISSEDVAGSQPGDLVPITCPLCLGNSTPGSCSHCGGDQIIAARVVDKSLTSWPRCMSPKLEELYCSECHRPQYTTPSGPCCSEGHGGSPGIPLSQIPVHRPPVQLFNDEPETNPSSYNDDIQKWKAARGTLPIEKPPQVIPPPTPETQALDSAPKAKRASFDIFFSTPPAPTPIKKAPSDTYDTNDPIPIILIPTKNEAPESSVKHETPGGTTNNIPFVSSPNHQKLFDLADNLGRSLEPKTGPSGGAQAITFSSGVTIERPKKKFSLIDGDD